MSIFGDIEELLSDLYPYRWPISVALAGIMAMATAFAYRRGLHVIAWRHKAISVVSVAIFLAVAIPAGDYFLSPLWERSTLCEASPLPGAGAGSEKCPGVAIAAMDETPTPAVTPNTTSPSASAAPTPTPAATAEPTPAHFEPRVANQGQFHGADDFHFGSGNALLIETTPGQYALRFEEFSVRNGPDLYVYLSTSADGYSDDGLNLGNLKATDGAFNYDVPQGTDVSRFRSAIIWCKQFSVLFAVAPFVEA